MYLHSKFRSWGEYQISFLLLQRHEGPDTTPKRKTLVLAAAMDEDRTGLFLEVLIAILIPPLGVCLRHGCCSCEFFICLLLTLLGYVPGIIYAVYAIVVVHRRDRFPDGYYQPVYQPGYA